MDWFTISIWLIICRNREQSNHHEHIVRRISHERRRNMKHETFSMSHAPFEIWQVYNNSPPSTKNGIHVLYRTHCVDGRGSSLACETEKLTESHRNSVAFQFCRRNQRCANFSIRKIHKFTNSHGRAKTEQSGKIARHIDWLKQRRILFSFSARKMRLVVDVVGNWRSREIDNGILAWFYSIKSFRQIVQLWWWWW